MIKGNNALAIKITLDWGAKRFKYKPVLVEANLHFYLLMLQFPCPHDAVHENFLVRKFVESNLLEG